MPIKRKTPEEKEKLRELRACAALGKPRVWFFDMDDTLYNASEGMFEQIHLRMEDFIARALNLPLAQAAKVQEDYWAQYGATFLGLAKHHAIDPHEFFAATHTFDLPRFLHSDMTPSQLRHLLIKLPGRKAVITNGPREYAETIVRTLRVEDRFERLFTASDMNALGRWRCKPDTSLLAMAVAQMRVLPQHCVLVEDSLANLKSAKKLGMKTVWCVGYRRRLTERCKKPAYVDVVIENIAELIRLATRG